MTLHKMLLAAAAVSFALPAFAESAIAITDPYARFMPGAKAGAAFMVIENTGTEDDRLIDARADISVKTELHTHKAGDGGMMQMVHVPEGFPIPAGASHALARGGDHVMFMGLKSMPRQGDMIPLTLVFEKAGEVQVEVPVDMMREDAPMQGGMGAGHMHGQTNP